MSSIDQNLQYPKSSELSGVTDYEVLVKRVADLETEVSYLKENAPQFSATSDVNFSALDTPEIDAIHDEKTAKILAETDLINKKYSDLNKLDINGIKTLVYAHQQQAELTAMRVRYFYEYEPYLDFYTLSDVDKIDLLLFRLNELETKVRS